MKDYLDLAQDFIDTGRTIPDEILQQLNFRERQLITKMLEIKNQLKTKIDHSLPDRTLHIVKQPDSSKKRYRLDLRMLYAAAALLAIAIYLFQAALSFLWARRFRFGPAEWLWRTATYGRLQPLRIT